LKKCHECFRVGQYRKGEEREFSECRVEVKFVALHELEQGIDQIVEIRFVGFPESQSLDGINALIRGV